MQKFTLSNFYTSREWAKVLGALKDERANEQGLIICEYCGQPILRKYDCIGHHKIELTEDNVNDLSISMNPENIMLIHFRCHNLIHQRFEGYRQNVYLVYGSPCSGKTTFVRDNANADDLILDVDRLWDAICNGGRYDGKTRRSNRLRANVFGLRDCLIEQIKLRTGKWRNAYIIGGYPLQTDRERLCNLLGARPIYIEATREECLTRAEAERPEAWKDYINNWFDSFTA